MYNSTEAYEAHLDGEPIMITIAAANKLIDSHNPGDDRAEFWNAYAALGNGITVDAWEVLEWLGY